MFDSPWAKTTEDEVFFTNTLDTIGNIVRDDVKLGTLYLAITLLTPDGTISNDIKVVSWIYSKNNVNKCKIIRKTLTYSLLNKNFASWCSDIWKINIQKMNWGQNLNTTASWGKKYLYPNSSKLIIIPNYKHISRLNLKLSLLG